MFANGINTQCMSSTLVFHFQLSPGPLVTKCKHRALSYIHVRTMILCRFSHAGMLETVSLQHLLILE